MTPKNDVTWNVGSYVLNFLNQAPFLSCMIAHYLYSAQGRSRHEMGGTTNTTLSNLGIPGNEEVQTIGLGYPILTVNNYALIRTKARLLVGRPALLSLASC